MIKYQLLVQGPDSLDHTKVGELCIAESETLEEIEFLYYDLKSKIFEYDNLTCFIYNIEAGTPVDWWEVE